MARRTIMIESLSIGPILPDWVEVTIPGTVGPEVWLGAVMTVSRRGHTQFKGKVNRLEHDALRNETTIRAIELVDTQEPIV